MNIVINLSAIPAWVYWTVGVISYLQIGKTISYFYAKRQKKEDMLYNANGCGKPCCATGICGKDGHTCRMLGTNYHDVVGDLNKGAKIFSIVVWPVVLALHLTIMAYLASVSNTWQKAANAVILTKKKEEKAAYVARATKGQEEFARKAKEASKLEVLGEFDERY
jgi:hypothetical protein